MGLLYAVEQLLQFCCFLVWEEIIDSRIGAGSIGSDAEAQSILIF